MKPIEVPVNANLFKFNLLSFILGCSSSHMKETPSICFAIDNGFSIFLILSFNLLSDGGPVGP